MHVLASKRTKVPLKRQCTVINVFVNAYILNTYKIYIEHVSACVHSQTLANFSLSLWSIVLIARNPVCSFSDQQEPSCSAPAGAAERKKHGVRSE